VLVSEFNHATSEGRPEVRSQERAEGVLSHGTYVQEQRKLPFEYVRK
jgi:hypothetical protein